MASDSELLVAADPESNPTATTISSLARDELLEIFLRLPDLPALARAPFTCRTWWNVADCCDGYILLWDTTEVALAALNPITWAVHSLPMPPADDIRAGADSAEDIWADADNADDSLADADNLGGFTFLGFHILSSEDNPRSFRVVCICSDEYRVRTAVFSSETWDWVIHPWVEGTTMRANDGMMAAGSIYWPCPSYGTGSMIKIDTATMDITTLDMPNGVDMGAGSIKVGETKDGELCIAHASYDLLLNVWIHSVDGDGIQGWTPHRTFSMSSEIDRVSQGWARHYDGDLEVV
uniref:F-box protein AT5G49610-like beta-propeller domain-containing protein n=1 Tax=Aegilops tauschii TaxID=37682 RepID=M8CWR6_AEGTA